MGAFCCHGNQSFDPICPKTLCSLSPTPVMLHIKFDQDWPIGFKFESVDDNDDGRRRTDDGPLVYYKLTLWAFGPGEIKIRVRLFFIHIPYIKFQNPTSNRSWPYAKRNTPQTTDGPKPICPLNFFEVGDIITALAPGASNPSFTFPPSDHALWITISRNDR